MLCYTSHLAICEVLEFGEQGLHVILGLLRLGVEALQAVDLPVLHQKLHDGHIVLQDIQYQIMRKY